MKRDDGGVGIEVTIRGERRVVTPVEVMGAIVNHLKTMAERYLKTTMTYASFVSIGFRCL